MDINLDFIKQGKTGCVFATPNRKIMADLKETIRALTDPNIKRKRAKGFYWVKWQGLWEVCEWNGYSWLVCGVNGIMNGDFELYDNQTEQIDERIIINPNL